jgi:plastocyanin
MEGVRARLRVSALLIMCALLGFAAPASAKKDGILEPATYPDMTTYSCRTEAIPIYPGQNTNLITFNKPCPNAQKISGPGDAGVFAPGSTAEGYMTRFRPDMVEIKRKGKLVTPKVWDLHLHHAVWFGPDGPAFGTGEEKTSPSWPAGYGMKLNADDDLLLNYMLHALTAEGGRGVYLTWEIDWVPETNPPRTDINPVRIRWMDVAGSPQLYPVFDAERGFDLDGDGLYVFPDEVPTDPSLPGYEERAKISPTHRWTVPGDGVTLVGGFGHLHPGGLHVDLEVARDGPDAGEVDGDDPAEVRRLFRSNARYYDPAGAVSWDMSMEGTRPEWRISLEGGDTLSIDTTYDVKRASWYESMGILPLSWTDADDPTARDPFDDEAAVRAMYEAGGILSHGRLRENIDKKARKGLRLADPRRLPSRGLRVPNGGIDIEEFTYAIGGYSAFPGIPTRLMRPPAVKPGEAVTFTNLDAPEGLPDTEQVWHSITSCKAPCNRGSGIGAPLARGPIKFDSGQLGYGSSDLNPYVTTNSNTYTTPPLTKPGKTYTYFCRIHPFMRGSIRVRDEGR